MSDTRPAALFLCAMADHSEDIRNLEEALASGLRTVMVEGTQHTYGTTDEIRTAIRYFKQRDDTTIASGKNRRTFNRIKLF